jgi:hypothetical protein
LYFVRYLKLHFIKFLTISLAIKEFLTTIGKVLIKLPNNQRKIFNRIALLYIGLDIEDKKTYLF